MLKYSVVFNVCVVIEVIAISFADCSSVNFAKRNRAISECVNGYKSSWRIRDPEQYITTSQFARKNDYPAEEHVVVTDDGYILTLHRIPGRPGAPPIFLQHGLLSSSFDWLVLGKDKALAFKLANAGYDVWMGNYRGNTYSRCHTTYKTSNSKFWDFSWHEMGIHDLPAMITYVTNVTNQKVMYIGHSMGTTGFFVMASEKPDIASKVKVMFALAPVAYVNHATSPVRLLAPFTDLMEWHREVNNAGEFLSQSHALKLFVKNACTLTMLDRQVCVSVVFSTIYFNPKTFNYTLVPEILYHHPAGSSLKAFIHYFQEMKSGRFQYYNYGTEKNLELYDSIEPPVYNISKITVPVGLIWSDNDSLSNVVDVMRLHERLPNSILNYRVEKPNFNHIDYVFSSDAPNGVYEKLLTFIENYK